MAKRKSEGGAKRKRKAKAEGEALPRRRRDARHSLSPVRGPWEMPEKFYHPGDAVVYTGGSRSTKMAEGAEGSVEYTLFRHSGVSYGVKFPGTDIVRVSADCVRKA